MLLPYAAPVEPAKNNGHWRILAPIGLSANDQADIQPACGFGAIPAICQRHDMPAVHLGMLAQSF
jgi:hypothetical protein